MTSPIENKICVSYNKYKVIELQSKQMLNENDCHRISIKDVETSNDTLNVNNDLDKKLFPYNVELIYKSNNLSKIIRNLNKDVNTILYLWLCFMIIQYRKVKNKISEFDSLIVNEIEVDIKSVLHQNLYFKYTPQMNKIVFYHKIEEYYNNLKWFEIVTSKQDKIIHFLKIWSFILN